MEKEVGIANTKANDVMKKYASDYLKRKDVKELIQQTVASFMEPDNYN
jgi:hypothetical protein